MVYNTKKDNHENDSTIKDKTHFFDNAITDILFVL